MPELPPLIAVLERHGIEHVGRFVETPEHPEAAEAARRISNLRVHRALRLGPPVDGAESGLFIAMTTGLGSDFDSLNELVAECALAKLAMATLPPRPSVPELPPEIDVVWAATGGPVIGVRVLYRLARGGVWERV